MLKQPILSPFRLREADAGKNDFAFLVSSFDSILPFLASIGSYDQWGSVPFSQRGDFSQDTLIDLQNSVENGRTGNSNAHGLRIFIVDREYPEDSADQALLDKENISFLRVEADGRRFLPVGFAYVRENWIPDYVKAQPCLQNPAVERFDYLEVIITDSRVPASLRRGAGAALIRGAREYSRDRQRQELWVDSWAGNERRLVKYYEEQGFRAVGDWSHARKDKAP